MSQPYLHLSRNVGGGSNYQSAYSSEITQECTLKVHPLDMFPILMLQSSLALYCLVCLAFLVGSVKRLHSPFDCVTKSKKLRLQVCNSCNLRCDLNGVPMEASLVGRLQHRNLVRINNTHESPSWRGAVQILSVTVNLNSKLEK